MSIPPTYRVKWRYLILEGDFGDFRKNLNILFGRMSEKFIVKLIFNHKNKFIIRCNREFLKEVLAAVAYSKCKCLRICGTIKSSLKYFNEN
jgi:RNase P/RNase MRP subunit POP5